MSTTTVKEDPHSDPVSDEHAAILKAYQKPSYRYLVLGILTTVYVSNFVDRQVINVLAQPIIDDLNISDGNSECSRVWHSPSSTRRWECPLRVGRTSATGAYCCRFGRDLERNDGPVCAAQSFAQLFLARFGVGRGSRRLSTLHSTCPIFPCRTASHCPFYLFAWRLRRHSGWHGGRRLFSAVLRLAHGVRRGGDARHPAGAGGALRRQRAASRHGGSAQRRRAARLLQCDGFCGNEDHFAICHSPVPCMPLSPMAWGTMPLFLGRVHGMPILDVGWYYGMIAGVVAWPAHSSVDG